MRLKFTALTLALAGLVLTSCGGDKEDGDDQLADSTKVDSASIKPPVTPEISYQVPSPGEMLSFIKMVGGKNNKNTSFLNPADNAKSYADAKSKALNFGVYSCDLSYCSIFEIGTEAIKYFKVVKQLGDEIGVSSTLRPEIMKRLEANMGNSDSLAMITDEVYYSSFENLQSSQHGNTLALVIAGGYIESLHIACNLVKYEAGSPAVDRIADQKYTLENIIEFMKTYQDDADVKSTIETLSGLKAVFDKVDEKSEGATAMKDDKGKKILGGGTTLVMTKELFKQVSDKVAEIRNSFSQTK